MSTDAERLAALLHDNDLIAICFHARDGGGFAGPRACVEMAERLIAAGVGFPAAPDEGLDVCPDCGLTVERIGQIHITAQRARLRSEAPAPEDV